MSEYRFEVTSLLLNFIALILCVIAIDYIILGLGILALLFSFGFHKLISKPRSVNKSLNSSFLLLGIALSSSAILAALYFNYFYNSIQGLQTVFIISAYMCGINIAAIAVLKGTVNANLHSG